MRLPLVARLLTAGLAVLLGVQVTALTYAQSTPIEPFVPYEGELTVPGATDLWTFGGLEGGIVSVLVTSGGTLDPIIELRNSSGQILASNDDFAYPGRRDALIQAATLPRIDTYSIAVYGFGQTIGTYTLSFMPGYADPALNESFNSAGRWRETGDTGAVLETQDGQLRVTVEGVRVPVPILDGNGPTFGTFFASARISVVRGPSGWRAGLTLRGTPDGAYGLMLGDGGSWRMDYFPAEGEPRQIRDWTFPSRDSSRRDAVHGRRIGERPRVRRAGERRVGRSSARHRRRPGKRHGRLIRRHARRHRRRDHRRL
ncbi:MAG: PPC domain-containing protein [Chloroflexi bacterium]|nr:PPC domain-containing protein [Chloroflexota bacterium]